MQESKWTFLTNHARVLVYIAKHPQSTARQIAQEIGITERAIQKIIADLEADGYITRHREGRCNRYTIHHQLPMRHRLEREYAIADLLLALGCKLKITSKKEGEDVKKSDLH